METERLNPRDRFIERMGLCAEEEGLPRIGGRLMGLMMLEGGPFSFDELVDRLQVSRGSVSTNTRMLEARGVIERIGRPGERQLYYRVAEDPYHALVTTVLRRKRRMQEFIGEALEALSEEREEERERLGRMQRFHEILIRNLEATIEEWDTE